MTVTTRSQSNEKNIDPNTTNPVSQLSGNPLLDESETLGSSPTPSNNTVQPNSGTPSQERISELFSTPYSNIQAPFRSNQNYPTYDSANFRPRIQLRSPEVFSGNQAEYEGFNFSMQNEFRANASYYSSDSERIAYCSSFLGGAALSYYQSQVPIHPEVQSYWPAFQQVIDFFKPVNQNAVTLSSLRGIHQTTTTRAYAEAFLPLATKLFGSFPDAFLCQQFIYGLPSNISNALLSFPLDSNLQVTVERAIAIDDRIRDQNAEIRRRAQAQLETSQGYQKRNQRFANPIYSKANPPSTTPVHFNPNFQPAPPQYSPSTLPRRNPGPLSVEERLHRVNNNLCIICGSPDHQRVGCPRNRNRSQLNVMSTQQTATVAPVRQLPSGPIPHPNATNNSYSYSINQPQPVDNCSLTPPAQPNPAPPLPTSHPYWLANSTVNDQHF